MTKKLAQHVGVVIPLDIANIDTDAIIPKQFLQKVTKTGFGIHLFHDWRFLDDAGKQPDPDFVLNFPVYQGASILLTRENFGCGSSREHAPWALTDYGFQVIIAPSFADIFYSNALNNQLLLVTLNEEKIEALFKQVQVNPGMQFFIDVKAQTVTAAKETYHFALDEFRKQSLLEGLDSIGLTLKHESAIIDYEQKLPAFMV